MIPSIDQMRQRPAVMALEAEYGQGFTRDALRTAADDIRAAMTGGRAYPAAEAVAAELEARAAQALAQGVRGSLQPVINATGVILHTNLGRAPLGARALDRIAAVARGYCTLEYDLEHGGRGSRTIHAARLLPALTGAEAALVVNNNAAATLLILAALASGREVVISRGELVEIGGGFRVPDVMAQSGALLREVGTTNRTRAADYRASIGERTAMLLRVHPSNFRLEGFTARPSLDEMVAVAREAGLPLVEDLGSGCIDRTLAWEPSVQQSIAAGVDVVCFSGDKMLGGPQAGVIVGRRVWIERLQKHPLMRALRVDKLTLAALEGTLIDYRRDAAARAVPVLAMLHEPVEHIAARARRVGDRLRTGPLQAALVEGTSTVGGGSAPGVELPTVLIAMTHTGYSPDALEERLRAGNPPVIARIESDRVVLDLRTVLPQQDEAVVAALLSV